MIVDFIAKCTMSVILSANIVHERTDPLARSACPDNNLSFIQIHVDITYMPLCCGTLCVYKLYINRTGSKIEFLNSHMHTKRRRNIF